MSQRLLHLRQNFNHNVILQASNAKRTFEKHESNHERIILWLYKKKSEFLHTELLQVEVQALDDVDSSVDIQSVVSKHTQYVKRGGKKSLGQQMEEQRSKELREAIKEFLGLPGLPPARATVKLPELEANPKLFSDYLTDMRKGECGGILRSGAYCAMKSSYMYLFRRYKYHPSRAFEEALKEVMEGVKRISTLASQYQYSEGNLWDGDKPLTWALYQQFNRCHDRN